MKHLLFYSLPYIFLILISLGVFTIYKPFSYIDNVTSYIVCSNGSKFEIGPNFIYTFNDSLDKFNDKKARKLCAYGLIKDYQDTLETPAKKNYTFHPAFTQESSWLRTFLSFIATFFLGALLIEIIKKMASKNVLRKTDHDEYRVGEFIHKLGFSPEVLLFTNAFIFIYTIAVENLRIMFPAKPNDDFLILGVAPEPFEIPIYVGLMLFFHVVIYLLHRRVKSEFQPFPKILKYILLFLLTILFVKSIGDYPLKDIQTGLTENFFLLLYLTTILLITFEIFVIERFLKKKKLGILLLYLGIILLILLVTFPPRFSISGVDYSYFFGPIWEIANGKTIYTEVSSQYGFVSILFLTVLYKLTLLPLAYLPVFVWLLFSIQYFLCFYLIYKQSGSVLFGLIGLFSILTINFFTVRVIPTDYPQSGPLRWLPFLLPLFFLYHLNNPFSYRFIFIVAVASLWMVDSGIELLLGLGFSVFLLWLKGTISIKKVFSSFFTLGITLLAIFFFLNIIHLLLGYQIIQPLSIFSKLQQYAKAGFGMLPMESRGYFWFVILFYFASIIYVFRNKNKTQNLHDNTILIFSANLMFFASFYYVGRSHPAELYTISLFILLNAFLLIGSFFSTLQKRRAKFIVIIFILIFFIAVPAYKRSGALTQSIQTRIKQAKMGSIFKPEMGEILQKKYRKEIPMIQKAIPEKEILIISGDDTYLFYLTGKKNFLNDNSLVTILTKKDLESSLHKAAKVCPKKIVGECRLFKTCPETDLFSKAFYAWQPIILSALQNKCGIQYKPINCTNQLCIAEKN